MRWNHCVRASSRSFVAMNTSEFSLHSLHNNLSGAGAPLVTILLAHHPQRLAFKRHNLIYLFFMVIAKAPQ